MSKFINEVQSAEQESEQKPVVTQYAVIYVEAKDAEKFTRAMERLPESYTGALQVQLDSWLVGWMTYTARGANITDISRRVEKHGGIAHPIGRQIHWDSE